MDSIFDQIRRIQGLRSARRNLPSTGKSSNSSSSSSAVAGLGGSLNLEDEVESETAAFVVGAEPAGAADMVEAGPDDSLGMV